MRSNFVTQKKIAFWSLLLFLALLATYSNHFENEFHFDDSHTIENNVLIQDLKNIPQFFVDARTFEESSSTGASPTDRCIQFPKRSLMDNFNRLDDLPFLIRLVFRLVMRNCFLNVLRCILTVSGILYSHK